MKTRGKKTVQIVSTADIASAPSTSQSQIVTYPNAGPSTGHGPQVVVSRTVSPSKLDETSDQNWKKFAEEFRLHIMELYPEEDIYKTTFNELKNRKIYQVLLQATGTKCFNMVHRVYKDKGKEAFLFLEEYFLGSIEQRKQEVFDDLTAMDLTDSDSIPEFCIKLQNMNEDCKSFNLLNPALASDEPSLLVSLALKSLPPRMHSFAARCRERPDGPLSLQQLIRLLLNEDHAQRRRGAGRNSQNVNAARNLLEASRAHGPRRRGGRGRGRGGIGRARPNGSHATPQQQQQQQQRQQPPSRRSSPPPPQQQQYQQRHQQQQQQQRRGMAARPADRPRYWNHSRRQITCNKCKSTNGSHTEDTCWSTKWCSTCQSASHDRVHCRFGRR